MTTPNESTNQTEREALGMGFSPDAAKLLGNLDESAPPLDLREPVIPTTATEADILDFFLRKAATYPVPEGHVLAFSAYAWYSSYTKKEPSIFVAARLIDVQDPENKREVGNENGDTFEEAARKVLDKFETPEKTIARLRAEAAAKIAEAERLEGKP